jgi:hypothetical protein
VEVICLKVVYFVFCFLNCRSKMQELEKLRESDREAEEMRNASLSIMIQQSAAALRLQGCLETNAQLDVAMVIYMTGSCVLVILQTNNLLISYV